MKNKGTRKLLTSFRVFFYDTFYETIYETFMKRPKGLRNMVFRLAAGSWPAGDGEQRGRFLCSINTRSAQCGFLPCGAFGPFGGRDV